MIEDQTNQDKESDAIKKIVAGVEAAFNRHDIDELDSHYTANSVRVDPFGKKLVGFGEVNEDYKKILTGPLRDAYARHRVENILFLRPDVAVVHVDQKPTTPEGKLIEKGQGSIAMLVMVKEGESWSIAASQNTLVTL